MRNEEYTFTLGFLSKNYALLKTNLLAVGWEMLEEILLSVNCFKRQVLNNFSSQLFYIITQQNNRDTPH